jgi:hypothetical protein
MEGSCALIVIKRWAGLFVLIERYPELLDEVVNDSRRVESTRRSCDRFGVLRVPDSLVEKFAGSL